MAITEFFAGVAVADFRARLAWYERLFGKPPDFFPQEGEAVWRVTEHAWVYVVADAERGQGTAHDPRGGPGGLPQFEIRSARFATRVFLTFED